MRGKRAPKRIVRNRSHNRKRLLRNGMNQFCLACMETDAAVAVGTRETILEVTFDRTSYTCELAAYLVVAACKKLHFHEEVSFRTPDKPVP